MAVTIALVFLALRAGLRLRRMRRIPGSGPRDPQAKLALRRRHLKLAKPGVVLALVGFVGGIASMVFLRGRAPFDTFHSLVASTAALLFVAAAVIGHRIEEGRSRAFEAHALAGGLAFLAAAVAAIAGFDLLP